MHLEVYRPPPSGEIAEPSGRCHAIVALQGPRQPNAPIQPAMARPISSGESSWRKWIPATYLQVKFLSFYSIGLNRERVRRPACSPPQAERWPVVSTPAQPESGWRSIRSRR